MNRNSAQFFFLSFFRLKLIKTHLISIIISRSILCTTSCLHCCWWCCGGMVHFKFMPCVQLLSLSHSYSVPRRFTNLSKRIKVSLSFRICIGRVACVRCIMRVCRWFIVQQDKKKKNKVHRKSKEFRSLDDDDDDDPNGSHSMLPVHKHTHERILRWIFPCQIDLQDNIRFILRARYIVCAIWYHHCMTWCNFQFCVKAQTKYYKQSPTWIKKEKEKRRKGHTASHEYIC